MKLCANARLARAVILAGWLALILGFTAWLALAATGCTVAPKPVPAQSASFGDDGAATSGFIGFVDGGGLIDAGARARYNALIAEYGREWLPALRRDEGLERRGEHYFITNAALQKFIVMSDWRRAGRKPQK